MQYFAVILAIVLLFSAVLIEAENEPKCPEGYGTWANSYGKIYYFQSNIFNNTSHNFRTFFLLSIECVPNI